MNYGYADDSDGNVDSTVDTSTLLTTTSDINPEQWERYALRMYDMVSSAAGIISVNDKDIVEVGCGRGGGITWIMKHKQPASAVAVDYSPVQVNFCNKTHKNIIQHCNLSFITGDAMDLPLDADAVDVVMNVESSHCYPNFTRFLQEVHRVLRPGGYFLFADFRDDHEISDIQQQINDSQLQQLHHRDITQHVVNALMHDHNRKQQVLASFVPLPLRSMCRMFVGTKESKTFNDFVNRKSLYFYYVLQKQ